MPRDERRQQLAEFLRIRRARLSPVEVGIPAGGRRRAPGLRREEVAQIAGVSTDWYTWLEQGRPINVSEQVLESLARALRLNPAEVDYLFLLADTHSRTPFVEQITPTLRTLLDLQGPVPAYIMGYRWDILAWNSATTVLYGDFGAVPPETRNGLWFIFAEPQLRATLVNWEVHAQRSLAQFRVNYGAYSGDPRFRELVSQLSERSAEFREWWPRHDVHDRTPVQKEYRHPVLGSLHFEQTTLHIYENPQLCLLIQVPIAGTSTLERMRDALQVVVS